MNNRFHGRMWSDFVFSSYIYWDFRNDTFQNQICNGLNMNRLRQAQHHRGGLQRWYSRSVEKKVCITKQIQTIFLQNQTKYRLIFSIFSKNTEQHYFYVAILVQNLYIVQSRAGICKSVCFEKVVLISWKQASTYLHIPWIRK